VVVLKRQGDSVKLTEAERAPTRNLVKELIAPGAEYALMCQVAVEDVGGLLSAT